MQKKFSYPVKIDELNQQEYVFHLDADVDELADIKDILQVEDVKNFVADIRLKLNLREHLLRVWGNVQAELELKSVITLNNFTKKYGADFNLIYDTAATYRDIREMNAGINDEVPDIIEGGVINLADIVLEQIALQMEDYPRAEGEVFDFSAYGFETTDDKEDKTHPFAVLAKLKK
ncbi:MAG: DUF177 domain-containing protein [Alphaproteobacteria bacterium]|nr:DUF177 domain-containing protein [Alphaproteobacteria bacterium]